MTPVHLTEAMPLADLPASIRSQLPALALASGRFNALLREPGEAVCVVALDARGAIAWAAAEPDGLLGCFVAPRWRRRGTGRRLVQALWPAACARWPLDAAAWHWIAREGSPGAEFWKAMGERVAGRMVA